MSLFLAAVVAASAAAPAPAPVDPAALAAATVLVQQMDVRGQVNREGTRTVAAMRSGAVIGNSIAQQPGFGPAYQANKPVFDAAFKKAGAIQAGIAERVFRENADAVVRASVTAFAHNFSAAELKGISDFYKTPLGIALNQRMPRAQGEIAAANSRIIEAKMAEGMKAAAPQLRAALEPLNKVAAAGALPPPVARKP